MLTVFKEFRFEAAHSLPHLPPEHKCSRKHGHSYHVRVEVAGEIGPDGFVIDYADIDAAWRPLSDLLLDHYDIDAVVQPSTSENLARWIFGRMDAAITTNTRRVLAVEVRETPTAGARYEGRA